MKIKSGLYCLVAIGLTLQTDVLLAVELLEDHRMVNTFFDGGSNIVVPDQDFADLNVFKMAFFTSEGDSNWNPDADFAGDPIDGGPDSFINFVDLTRMSEFFFAQPGPSATGCN